MIIEKDRVGVISYKINLGNHDGEVLEVATKQLPKTILFGNGKFLESFEKRLLGLKANQQFQFILDEEDAFGIIREDAILDLDRKLFQENGVEREDLLAEGKQIHMQDDSGNPYSGIVLEVKEDSVRIDFNHPLAGEKLYVTGEIHDVREATEQDFGGSGGCCGGGCGCSSSSEGTKSEEDDCQVCGNPPELQGQGVGSCQCT